jgi:Ethanolamine utilization protein EutJ (predicted chaperonin)
MPQVLTHEQVKFQQIKRREKHQAVHAKKMAPIEQKMAEIRANNPTISESLCRTLAFRIVKGR